METVERLEMRRLDADTDALLIAEAVRWIDDAPRWMRDCDDAWGKTTAGDYLEQMKTTHQADFGVFDDGEFVAVITVSLEGHGVYNSHLMAKRAANPETLKIAIANVLNQMQNQGMLREGWMWLARRNYGVRRIVEAIGIQADGVTRFKGQSHGQPIEWLRHSVSV